MDRRNWVDLSRKLVDRFDMSSTMDDIEAAIDSYAQDYYGVGCAQTPEFPNGLSVTLSSASMAGSLAAGVAFDPQGNRIKVPSTQNFSISAAPPSNARWDLLALRYKKTGANLIPKPSDPITNVYLNLIDDYDLVLIPGTPSVSPEYPSIEDNDVIVMGIKVNSLAVVGTDCVLDDTIRMFAVPPASRLLRKSYAQVIPGTGNAQWLLPQSPADKLSAAVFVDAVPQDDLAYSISGNVITFQSGSEPAAGQDVFAVYLVNQTGAMAQAANTIPGGKMVTKRIGTGDGVQDTFLLPYLPIDPGSVSIFVDGLVLDDSEFTVSGQSVVLSAGSIPADGLSVTAIQLIGSTSILGVVETGGGAALLTPYGSRGAPVIIDPTVSVSIAADDRQMRFIACSPGAGASAMTAVPQIAAGSMIGQELVLKGRDAADYPIFHDGDGLELNGNWNGSIGQSLTLVWDGAVWSENGRK